MGVAMQITNHQDKSGDRAAWVGKIIKTFIERSPENILQRGAPEPAWSEPLIGFAGGNDPLFQQIKRDIGEFYWTPADIFRETFQRVPEQLTVISWILPQTDVTKRDNRNARNYPSERWSRSRSFGELTNVALARHLTEMLQRSGISAVAPVLSPLWCWQTSERYGFASNWSERHAAYAAGLGTFGLCDGLITPKGKAMRCGSVVADIRVEPTARPYSNHRAWCLFFSSGGKCKKCIARCPVGALSENGHDKLKCRNFLFDVVADYAKSHFGFASYGCGLCQTGVPCESGIPMENSKNQWPRTQKNKTLAEDLKVEEP
jgi:epoxyqueuosine reductase